MGRWGIGIFDDDLAAVVRSRFNLQVTLGKQSPAQAAMALMECDVMRGILQDRPQEAWNEDFWEERGSAFIAVASLQLSHGVLQDKVRALALEAISYALTVAHEDRIKVLRTFESELRELEPPRPWP